MSGPGVLRLSDWLGVCRMWLVKLEMRMIAAVSAVIGYPMHSVRTLAGDFIFMLLPAGGLGIGFWSHGKLSIGNASFVHKFYTCAA